MLKESLMFRVLACVVAFAVGYIGIAHDALAAVPQAATAVPVGLSQAGDLPFVRGVNFDPANPFEMQFIIDPVGQKNVNMKDREKILRYFLAALTIPEDKLWVNLSPYEKDRVIEDTVAQTEIGETLLEQDYLLKQLSASLTMPGTEIGDAYWNSKSEILNLKSQIINQDDLSKIWIKPSKVSVYDENKTVFISGIEFNVESESTAQSALLPAIKNDVNTGKNFATLRQMVYSIVLAQWFKRKFAKSLYAFYFDAEKTAGIDIADPAIKQKVFEKYVAAFNQGAYDVTKKVRDENNRLVKRRYFSGGVSSALHDMKKANVAASSLNNKFASSTMETVDVKAEMREPVTVYKKLAYVALASVFFCSAILIYDYSLGSSASIAGFSFALRVILKVANKYTTNKGLQRIIMIGVVVCMVATIGFAGASLPNPIAFTHLLSIALFIALSDFDEKNTKKLKQKRQKEKEELNRKIQNAVLVNPIISVEHPESRAIEKVNSSAVEQAMNAASNQNDFIAKNGGIDLNGMLDGVKVYESSSAIQLDSKVASNVKGITFRIVGEEKLLPLNKIIQLAPVI